MFTTVLIANRGEIACRIIRTARALGYRTVAVYSEADADARHVRLADLAVPIGPASASASYLDIGAVLAAAEQAGADAIHPGYGFLSENGDFAEACERAGIVFIGPTPGAIRAMGNKAAAKRLMIAASVPCVPGYQGADQSDAALMEAADRIGLPIMVKAAAGGGGRGMRLVHEWADLAAALAGARSEATSAFGSGELILEKAVIDARHVEIQVFADSHGNVVHLGERDCSIQRRHQKVVEEAPSPAVDPALRARMGAAAVEAARAIDYRGAGTVEFLLAASGEFYFLEMNTRLQVEHPVTELVTGLDLVEWQLRVANGESLPRRQDEIVLRGHAIEVRLYAEDPYDGFLPQTGTILEWRPAEGAGRRVDHGLRVGQAIGTFYDPMLAKVIATGATREESRRRLVRALDETCLLGVTTNRHFLARVLDHPEFREGSATTAFLVRHADDFATGPEPSRAILALAAILLRTRGQRDETLTADWSSTGAGHAPSRLRVGGRNVDLVLGREPDGSWRVRQGEGETSLAVEIENGSARFLVDGVVRQARFAFDAAERLHLDGDGLYLVAEETLLHRTSEADRSDSGRVLAPMSGVVTDVLARVGDRVSKGDPILVLEAMKMQLRVVAQSDGDIATLSVKRGDQVSIRQLLATLATE
ncbi:acetyl-CoA carboxylase biotin carboxylase subunit [Methylobacterium terricola]|uniref:Acetyl-CoA carboxylase biotin carboxylase subunit n=1 Tax=Methylobacterium terricola TaxID=2583531 RepID=A0A5C4LIL9_9HYPH|nr:acetyl-CoA carboxylase biotin carboxylase subunit [Methylobacterium terricola]TNC13015.1 acetyl-CoA carboxylase biotin carboxylase subunit [Methylobacterium terricola]